MILGIHDHESFLKNIKHERREAQRIVHSFKKYKNKKYIKM
jgi:hypothetical protein